MPKIEIKNVSKVFGSHPKEILKQLPATYDKSEILNKMGHNVAVSHANLSVEEGELYIIIGMSGSGKSTLIRCLNLLTTPTEGEIIIDGEDILKYDKKQLLELRRKKVSMVFQNFGLLSHKNVLDNVAFGLDLNGAPKAYQEEKARAAIVLVGLEGYENASIGSLSGGMKQRVGLARALAGDCEILLMDEPFSALDPIVRRDMQFELLNIQKTLKKTIIFITHDINEAFKLGEHISIMKDGVIVQTGTPEEILKSPADEFVSNFIMDIDKTKVITARNIMNLPTSMVFDTAGPHWAIKEMKANGLSSVFVIDSGMHLKGLITLDGAVEAINQCVPISQVMVTDIPITTPDTKVNDLLVQASNAKYPISVVDDDNKFLGIVTRVAVMSALVDY